jgi:hypothetical protein
MRLVPATVARVLLGLSFVLGLPLAVACCSAPKSPKGPPPEYEEPPPPSWLAEAGAKDAGPSPATTLPGSDQSPPQPAIP